MNKNLLVLSLFLLSFSAANAQAIVDTTGVIGDSYNRWSIEVSVGQGKGVKPYSNGYYSSNPGKFFGGLQANSFGVGARYMISPKFGIRLDLNYDKLTNQSGTESLDFEMVQFRTAFQGVANLIRLFNIEEAAGRFGLLLHGGIQIAAMTPNTVDETVPFPIAHNDGLTEWNGGIVVGFTPQYRISKSLAVFGDFSVLNNYRQHFNWDGAYSDNANNLSGQMIATSIGISFSFGNEKIHGDWAIIQDKNKAEMDKLDKRVGEMETMMNDADKDGVPDYLDVENNSF